MAQPVSEASEERFDSVAVERVLKRAMGIDSDELQMDPTGISQEALEQAAVELGVDPEHVRRALVEERVGLLDTPQSRLDSIVGPSEIVVSRHVEMGQNEVMAAVDAWLNKELMFHRVSSRVDGASYVGRRDMLAAIRRRTGTLLGVPDLSRVSRIDVRTSSDGAGRSIVVLRSDLRLERTAAIVTATGIAGVGSAASVAVAFAWGPAALPAVGIPFSFAASAVPMVIRARTLESLRVELDRVVELVSNGPPTPNVLADVVKRVMGVPWRR